MKLHVMDLNICENENFDRDPLPSPLQLLKFSKELDHYIKKYSLEEKKELQNWQIF